VRVLHRVFYIRFIAKIAADNTVQRLVVAPEENLEQLLFAGKHAPHHDFILKPRRRRLFQRKNSHGIVLLFSIRYSNQVRVTRILYHLPLAWNTPASWRLCGEKSKKQYPR